jgi:hypothetical protein
MPQVLWELMTWAPPFDGLNPYQIINTVQATSQGSGLVVPPPDQLPAGPLAQYSEYVALMADCWARDPAQRPAFEDVVNRLRAMLTIEARRHSSTLSSGALPSMVNSVVNSSAPSPQASIPLPRMPSIPRPAASGSQAGLPPVAQRPPAGQGSASSGASVSPFSTSTDPGATGPGSAFSGSADEGAAAMPTPFAASPFAAVAAAPVEQSPYASK